MGLLQTKKENSEHEVLLWPSGGALGPPCSAVGQENLWHLPHCWAGTDLGGDDALECSSLPPWVPRAGHSITARTVPAGRAELVPILWDIPGMKKGALRVGKGLLSLLSP